MAECTLTDQNGVVDSVMWNLPSRDASLRGIPPNFVSVSEILGNKTGWILSIDDHDEGYKLNALVPDVVGSEIHEVEYVIIVGTDNDRVGWVHFREVDGDNRVYAISKFRPARCDIIE
ncbi:MULTISPECIES: hypothetical protein [unclassified Thioalkalivibrio]|uniref:hypothetical protein n=1 Tax=unclassified Thioalkalivibrio TaxID=2621013 RepID=UPI0003A95F6E|nr:MULTISPECIES: hypothetical protein [unclassified Thioalkalivibrio]